MSIETHHIAWTPEKVDRLWNYYGSNPAYKNAYFAKHSGHRILAEAAALVRISGDILDVGCGPGHLLLHIEKLPLWTSYAGIDSSESSLAEVRSKGKESKRRIVGMHVTETGKLKNESIDRVFCVEVVEHCDDTTLHEMFALLKRVLRTDGCVIITTPNSEDLSYSTQICPECGCIYHRWQHVRSWTCSGLSDFVRSCNFDVQSVFTCHFGRNDLGRRIRDRWAARLSHGKQWRSAFLNLPHIMLLAMPHKGK
jgi:SAM-dependent methyltransferase